MGVKVQKRMKSAIRIEASTLKQMNATIKAVHQDMFELTDGNVSSRQLAAEGHPFGRKPTLGGRLGGMRGDRARLPINHQSYGLQASLFIRPVMISEGNSYEVGFNSPHAIVLNPGGTATMAARGFWTEISQRAKRHAARVMRDIARDSIRR